ncbi:MAG: VapE domain-containing protein [Caldilineaceae bacterium]
MTTATIETMEDNPFADVDTIETTEPSEPGKTRPAKMYIEGNAAALLSHLGRGGARSFYWTSEGRRSLWVDPDKLPPIPAQWSNQNVYFGVHPCADIPPTNSKGEETAKEFVRSQIDYIAALNCFFAEFDAKDFEGGKAAILAHLDSFPQNKGWPYPSVIVDSGGGYHCYWLLEHTVTVNDENRVHLARVQAAWVGLVGGDNGAKDLSRVLRIPGTRNVKGKYAPDFPTVTIIEADFRRLFALRDFEELTEHLRSGPAPTPAQPVHQNGNGHYTFTDDLTKAAANLKRLRPGRADDYQEWLNVGMALSGLGDAGLRMWDDWSKSSGKYAPGVCDKKWGSFTPGDGLGLGSLAHWADEDDPSGKRIYTNGHGTPLQSVVDMAGFGNPSMDDLGLADGDEAEEESAGALLELLLDDLESVEDDRKTLQLFALEKIEDLAVLDAASTSIFFTHLRERGATTEWIRKELTPAINEAKANTASGGGDAAFATWTDYVQAAHALGYSFRLNDLNDTVEVNGERITDVHEATLFSLLHARGLKNVDVARRAFLAAAAQRRFHPVQEYLSGLKWDGKDHISTLAAYFTDKHDPITYADGTKRTVFHAFFRRWLVGATAKVYDPTAAQNPMLILAGGQGKGKSYFAKWLCPLPDLHFEGAIRPEDKDYLSYLTTRWIWEVGELGATIRKADREALKEFITKQDATFRPAYGRHALVKPALASFIGTVNLDGALLSDPTGHRRFWPVELAKDKESIDWGYATSIDVHQIWAQAYALYRAGEPWKLSTEEQAAHAVIVELYEVEDILAGYVQEYFRVEPDNPALYTHTTSIISTLRDPSGADVKGSERGLSMQLSSTLTRLGLVRVRRENRWGYLGIAKPTI